jgi:hypothetical protein
MRIYTPEVILFARQRCSRFSALQMIAKATRPRSGFAVEFTLVPDARAAFWTIVCDMAAPAKMKVIHALGGKA